LDVLPDAFHALEIKGNHIDISSFCAIIKPPQCGNSQAFHLRSPPFEGFRAVQLLLICTISFSKLQRCAGGPSFIQKNPLQPGRELRSESNSLELFPVDRDKRPNIGGKAV
jgi:hypothetical protein